MSDTSTPYGIISAAIGKVAPDVDLDVIDHRADLREEAELDSLDFLNVVTAVHEATGLEIPERDYPALGTIAGFVDYLSSRGVA
jgi:acyl carrier protein